MYEVISPTAAFGGLVTGERVIDARVRDSLKAILADIQSGAFAQSFIEDAEQGNKRLDKLIKKQLTHKLEEMEFKSEEL